MKIGIIAPFDVLTFSSGAANRVLCIARNLNQRGASVYVVHHGSSQVLESGLEFLHFNSFDFYKDSGNYLHPINIAYPAFFWKFLKTYKPDIIQCEQPWSAFPTLFLAEHFHVPCVLDEHNVEVLWSKHASKAPFLAPVNLALEKLALQSSLVLVTSKEDKKLLTQIYGTCHKKIIVVPNGVDVNYFRSGTKDTSELKTKLGLSTKRKLVLFHGLMSAKQNYEAAEYIITQIAPRIKETDFLIVGRGLPERLSNISRTQKNILTLGYVTNIKDYILAADICIAPIKSGSGTRLKILEYLAAGKPIIATSKAVEGIELVNGIHSLLFHEVNDDFIKSIRQLLTDNDKLQFLSFNAKEIAKKYDWKEIINPLYQSYEALLES